MSSASSSKSPLQLLLLLAVLGLCAWSGWLTMENQKLKQALGQGGQGAAGGELAGKVASLEETIENGLVLSLIDPSRGSTLLSQPVRPVSADKPIRGGGSPVPPRANSGPPQPESDDPNAPFDFSTGGNDERDDRDMRDEPGNSNAGGGVDAFPSPAPDSLDDVIDGFKGFNGGADFLNQGNQGNKSNPGGGNIAPDPGPDPYGPENAGPMPAPESGTVSSREPPPSTGTFGTSQNLLDGGGDTYLYELTILEVQDNGFIGLDGGSSSGVKVGAMFAVMRGSREIGKVRVQELSESRSIGEIAEYVGGVSIRKGDRVVPLRN